MPCATERMGTTKAVDDIGHAIFQQGTKIALIDAFKILLSDSPNDGMVWIKHQRDSSI